MRTTTPIGVIPPQDPNIAAEPRTMMLSDMAAELGWTYQTGPGPYDYTLVSPREDKVVFRTGTDLVFINNTRWRQEREAVERGGRDLLLPESTFNFVCRHFGQHHLVRLPRRNVKAEYRLVEIPRPEDVKPEVPARPPAKDTLKGLVICIDPGHGGRDPGGVANGVEEKDVCLAVGLLLRDLCLDASATVIMTRTTDIYPELEDRCILANHHKADIFVSVHANIAPNSNEVTGFEVFYRDGSAQGQRLAEAMIAGMSVNLPTTNRGTKVDPRGLRVLERTNMPAVLVELGFLSNPIEARWLATRAYQERCAKALYEGIVAFHRGARASVSR
jgi:N-acetylmuramoyl-L-alanine amidase